jgi:Na+/H+ antiporter NhaC
MNGKKLIAVSWWAFAYIILAAALFSFSALGDCLRGSDGAVCRERSKTVTNSIGLVLVIAYGLLTWLMFFRRR